MPGDCGLLKGALLGPPRSIVEVVLGVARPKRPRSLLFAVLLAASAHGSLWLWARRFDGSVEPLAKRATGHTAQVPRVYEIDLTQPPAAPRPLMKRIQPPTPSEDHRARRSRAVASKPAPALAVPSRAIVSPEATTSSPVALVTPSTPVDLTGETIVTGSATGQPGGATASRGSGTGAGRSGDGGSSAAAPPGPGLAAPVSLAGQSWACPWPPETEAQPIRERTVVIRAVVSVDGRAESVEVVSDPGNGFAAAAADCALHARFTPARGRNGEPVRAQSPPIRVRFTR